MIMSAAKKAKDSNDLPAKGDHFKCDTCGFCICCDNDCPCADGTCPCFTCCGAEMCKQPPAC